MSLRINTQGNQVARTTSLPSSSTFTVSFWVQIVTSTGSFQNSFSFDNNSGLSNDSIVLSTNAPGSPLQPIIFDSNSGGGAQANFTGNMVAGTWYFFAVTRTGSTTGAYWGDATSTAIQFVSCTSAQAHSFTTLRLARDDNTPAEWLNGRYQHFKCWSGVALSASEIAKEKMFGAPQRTDNIYMWTPFWDSATLDLNDYSGQGHNWTATGTNPAEQNGPIPIYNHERRRIFVAVPAANLTPLSWAPEFADFAPVAQRPLNPEGLYAKPARTLPTPLPVRSWAPDFPDFAPISRRPNNPEGFYAKPPRTLPTPVPLRAWAPDFPDLAPGPRPLVPEGAFALPVFPQPFPVPLLSWLAHFADLAPGPRPLVPEGAFVLPLPPRPFPVPLGAWAPEFADFASGPRPNVPEGFSVRPILPQPFPVPLLSWLAKFPEAAAGPTRTADYPLAVGPLIIIAAPTLTVDKYGWRAYFADFAPIAARSPDFPAFFKPVATLPTPVPSLSWLGIFPESAPGARPSLPGWVVAPILPPASVPLLAWRPDYPDAAPLALAALPTGFLVRPLVSLLPPTTWLPRFPDFARGRVNVLEGGLFRPTATLPTPVPKLSWLASYPDFARVRLPNVPEGFYVLGNLGLMITTQPRRIYLVSLGESTTFANLDDSRTVADLLQSLTKAKLS